MSTDPTDAELIDAVRAAPTPEARASLLGVDYAQLTAAAKRLEWLAAAGCALVLLIAGAVGGLLWPQQDVAVPDDVGGFGLDVVALLVGLGGVILTVVLFAVALFAGHLLSAVVVQRWGARVRRMSIVILNITLTGGLLAAVSIANAVGHRDLSLGVVVGAAMAPAVLLASMQELLLAIKRNTAQAVAIARHSLAAPAWLSLAGGRVRWLALGLTLSSVEFVSTAALLQVSAWWALPVIALGTLAGTCAAIATDRRVLAWWVVVASVSAAIFAALAILVLAR